MKVGKRKENWGKNPILAELPSGIRRSKLLKLPPMNGQVWWGINSVDSATRRYVSIRRRERGPNPGKNKFGNHQLPFIGQILINGQKDEEDDIIFHAKLMQAEERAREREMQRMEAVQQKQQGRGKDESKKGTLRDLGAEEVQMAIDGGYPESHENRQHGNAVLWTDKYAPKSFLELLTEDVSNPIQIHKIKFTFLGIQPNQWVL